MNLLLQIIGYNVLAFVLLAAVEWRAQSRAEALAEWEATVRQFDVELRRQGFTIAEVTKNEARWNGPNGSYATARRD